MDIPTHSAGGVTTAWVFDGVFTLLPIAGRMVKTLVRVADWKV